MKSSSPQLNTKIIEFYSDHLKNFGDSPKGVGWKDEAAQLIRFEQLLKIVDTTSGFSINDFGCGTGRLYHFLSEKGFSFKYNGYDIMEEMVSAASKTINSGKVLLKRIADPSEMDEADYTVASGIFNVRYDIPDDAWLKHILETITSINEKSKKGFSFNCLTKYSDSEFTQKYLYYADPLVLFDFCKTRFSKNVALFHDYNQYDFTMLIRK